MRAPALGGTTGRGSRRAPFLLVVDRMAQRRSARDRGRSFRSARRRRRRITRALTALVSAAAAAGAAWLFPGVRPTAADRPAPAPAAASRAPVPLGLTPGSAGLADPTVSGGRLELPVVDFTEVLPGCHR